MKKALIVVDIQRDFLPGGALPVPCGDEVIGAVNRLMADFEVVVAGQDWHPPGHGGFISQHPGKSVGDVIELNGVSQILWPDHCIQGSEGAMFAPGLNSARFEAVFQKGTDPKVDSYSTFFDNGRLRWTGLHDWLQARGVDCVHVAGLALDYCVKYSVLDAVSLGYDTHLRRAACRGVELQPGDGERAVAEMAAAGATIHG